jgi:hypothetical protein
MRNILLVCFLLRFSNILCQTFIVNEENMIINRDTSAFYGICGDAISLDVNSDDKIDFTIRYTCPLELCCPGVGYPNCRVNNAKYISIMAYNGFETYNDIDPRMLANYGYNDTLNIYKGDWHNKGWLIAEFYGGPECKTYYNIGNWKGHPGYIIFKNQDNNNSVYGWIEIQATKPDLGFQIYGFAIEDKKISGFTDNYLDGIKIVCESNNILVANIKDKISMSIIDLNGRIVCKQFIISDTNINIDHLKSGVYIVQISDDHSTIVKKIIK